MSDVVVTVPKNFTHPCAPGKRGLAAWIAEGDEPGDEWSGQEWHFTTYGPIPVFIPGDRCYIVCEGALRGYSPLIEVLYDESRYRNGQAPIDFVRGGGAVPVTIPEKIVGFRGWRTRWWDQDDEVFFPGWMHPDADPTTLVRKPHVEITVSQLETDE